MDDKPRKPSKEDVDRGQAREKIEFINETAVKIAAGIVSNHHSEDNTYESIISKCYVFAKELYKQRK